MATPADLPRAGAPDPNVAWFTDGLGIRRIALDEASGDVVEKLDVAAALARFATALHDRAARLANFRHPKYPRVRGVEVSDNRERVVVVSDPVEGIRLSQLLAQSDAGLVSIDVHIAIQVAREVLPALATLHGSRDVTHGALSAERLVLTKLGRVMVTDHTLGAAIDKLQYPRPRLWKDFRIAMPPAAGLPRFDQRADVAQVAVVVLELILGRSLTLNEFPEGLKKLLGMVTERLGPRGERSLSPSMKTWFEQALPVDARKPLGTALDAQIALEDALKREGTYAPDPVALRRFAVRAIELMPRHAVAPSASSVPIVIEARRSPAPSDVARPEPARRRAAPRISAVRRQTPEEEEAEEVAFLERELARLAEEERKAEAERLAEEGRNGSAAAAAVGDIVSTASQRLGTPPLLTLVADLEPPWCLTAPRHDDTPSIRDLSADVEVAFIDQDSFWLDFESMHVSRQVTAGAGSQVAHVGLSVSAARRPLAHPAAGVPTPVSVPDCTRLASIAAAARRYAPLVPAHAPFVRARDVAAPCASWLLPARASASVSVSLEAAPARAALPAFTRLARALRVLPFAPPGWRRSRPAVAPLALVADTLPARRSAAVTAAGDAVDYRDLDVDASERFDTAIVSLTCCILPEAVNAAAQVVALEAHRPATMAPDFAELPAGIVVAPTLRGDEPAIPPPATAAGEPAVDFDPSDPEIAALLRELEALESAQEDGSCEPFVVVPAMLATQAAPSDHQAMVPAPPVAALPEPLMPGLPPAEVEQVAPGDSVAVAAQACATTTPAAQAPTASPAAEAPATTISAAQVPTAAVMTAEAPAQAPTAAASTATTQADAVPVEASQREAQPALRTSKRSRRAAKKQSSPARPAPQPAFAPVEPPAPAPSRYAPWEVPQPSPSGAGDASQSIARSTFIDTPMPPICVAPQAEAPQSPATSSAPAAPLFETPAFKTGEHVVLAPASPVFADEPSEPEAAHSTKVHRFPSPFHARKINWKRTLAASLLLMLLEGAGFAAVYWLTQPSDVGYLMVRSSVDGLDVLIDGKPRGQTPLAVELPAGRHTIEMKGFGLSKVLPVEIASSVQTTQMVKWPRGQKVGTLQVSSAPQGARVIIDGEMRGVTPVTIESLVAGGHTLVLESDAGRVRQGVRVVADESTEVAVGIFAGWLNVFAPVQVRVFEDGKLLGTSEDGKMLLPPGEHHLELINQRLGLRERRTIEVTPGNTTTLSLDAPDGSIVVDAPEGTEVWIDGRARGVTPMAPVNTAVGTREVILRHPQIGQRRLAVQVGVKSPARAEFFTP